MHSKLKSAPPRGPKMRVQLYTIKDLNTTCPNCSHQFHRSVQKGVDVGIATLIAEAVVLALFACVTVQAVRKFHPSAA